MQTLAELEYSDGRVLVMLFFSRTRGLNNPRQVFPTLAYQLAVQGEAYRDYLIKLMTGNPGLLGKTVAEQFRHLIVEPLVRTGTGKGNTQPLVIMLDGLDECGILDGAVSQPQVSPDKSQREIIQFNVVRKLANNKESSEARMYLYQEDFDARMALLKRA